MRRNKRQTGFTLIEILISITFLSIVAIGVGQAVLTGQQLSNSVKENGLLVASCEDMMRQFSGMTVDDIVAQDGNTFNVGGVEGSGTISITSPYLSSDDIVHVVLNWNGAPVLVRAFGDAAVVASGGGGGGGEDPPEEPPAEPQWYDESHSQSSPNYPSNYPNNYDHTWTINEPGALKMKVHFTYFRTRNSSDKVYIKNGAGTTIASYYGYKGSFTSAEVTGDTIKIRFKTNWSGTRKGWKIDKYQYYK